MGGSDSTIRGALALARLAIGAEAEKLQGMKQGLKALQMGLGQLQAMDRAVWQPQGPSAIDTGEMVLIPLRGREEGFSAGEMAAAHQAPLLQLPQVAIHRGQAHGPLPCA